MMNFKGLQLPCNCIASPKFFLWLFFFFSWLEKTTPRKWMIKIIALNISLFFLTVFFIVVWGAALSLLFPDPCTTYLWWNRWVSCCWVPGFQTFCVFFPTSFVTGVVFTHMLPRQQGSSYDRHSFFLRVWGWILRDAFPPHIFISLLVSSPELIRSVREKKLLEVHNNLNNTVKIGFISFPGNLFLHHLVYYCGQTLISTYLPQTIFEKRSL